MEQGTNNAAPVEATIAQGVSVMCQCCGEIVTIADVHAFILSMHLQNVCPAVDGVVARG